MNKETKKITTVTPLELDILNEIEGSDLNDGTQECFYGPILHDFFDMKVMRGVISSLVKKGIVIYVDEFNSKTELVISKEYTAIHKDGYFVVANLTLNDIKKLD